MGIVDKMDSRHVEIPHEPGEWVRLRPLTNRELAEAGQAAVASALSSMKHIPPEVARVVMAQRGESSAAAESPDYDVDVLLKHAIVAWSYELPVASNTDRLDSRTANFLAGVILEQNMITEAEGNALSASSTISTVTEEAPTQPK